MTENFSAYNLRKGEKMPAPRNKSTSLRKVRVKTPGGRNTVHYRKAKPSKAICYECGAKLPGVASERPHKMRTMAKTKKRPERPFAGVLCSKCMRLKIVENSRK